MKLPKQAVPPSLTKRAAALDAALTAGDAAAGARAWLMELMQRDGPSIVRLLWRTLGNQQDVLDAYQEMFCRLLAADRASGRPPFRKYAYQVALNIAIDMRRRRQVQRHHFEPMARQRQPGPLMSQTPRPSYVELMDLLRAAVDALPNRLREVVILRDLGEMSYKDVGEILGLTIGTARVYRRDAIVQLSQMLRELKDL
ncbi:MAG: sigma-70 family RNA polymerase sigma factor [Phycisphaerae bacterium]|nr:sigma-70 family RNA polymerase sigma factor [Phycisphaerae bacterium]